jgi:DNA-binding NarL/FixJ family response regulator
MRLLRRGWAIALTERERQILGLHAEGLSDYRIARKLSMEMPNVKRSRKNALKKIDRARADIDFVNGLLSKYPHR